MIIDTPPTTSLERIKKDIRNAKDRANRVEKNKRNARAKLNIARKTRRNAVKRKNRLEKKEPEMTEIRQNAMNAWEQLRRQYDTEKYITCVYNK
jgi:hypothetical protein